MNMEIEASSPMTHDSASRAFTFYSEDFDLIGPQEFAVEAHLTNYPTLSTQEKAVKATLTIGDPCPDPNIVQATTQMSVPDYYFTNGLPKVVFVMNAFEVHPPPCKVTYTCSVSAGSPRSDICSIIDGETIG